MLVAEHFPADSCAVGICCYIISMSFCGVIERWAFIDMIIGWSETWKNRVRVSEFPCCLFVSLQENPGLSRDMTAKTETDGPAQF